MEERQAILQHLHQPRFIDRSVREIYTILLDEGIYLASVRTLQRILQGEGELVERRALRRHPVYQKPELLARGPNQLWSWDITKVRGPESGTWYQLYVVMDVYSRAVVGWLLAHQECQRLASDLIEQSCQQQGILQNQLTLHADRGAAMCSTGLASRLETLGVRKSHSRPHVSNDNPYSESQFKTMKYHPGYPDRFGSFEDAKIWIREYFKWYNEEHHHEGLAYLTPTQVHTGQSIEILVKRQARLERAYQEHPERFSRPPKVKDLPKEVWINAPAPEKLTPPTSSEKKEDTAERP